MKLKQVYTQFSYLFPLLMAFLLPLNFGIAMVSAVWLICFLFFGDLKTAVPPLFKNKWFYILGAFFIIHVVSYLYTDNKKEAQFSIEIKLSFLIYPFLVFTSRLSHFQAAKIITGFVSGCFFACIIDLSRALYYYMTLHVNYFYYSDFTNPMHPSYFAMYLVMAVLLLILWYPKWFEGKRSAILMIPFLFALFSVCIFISASKLGIISYMLLVPATIFYIQVVKKRYKQLFVMLAGIVILFFTAYKIFPAPFSRIEIAIKANSEEHIDKTSKESTVVRKMIWHEASEIIKQHPWTGVGAGDANDELYKAYERSGMTGALFKHLNAHNQYLQTLLGTGIIGFLLLITITFYTAILGVVKKNANLFLFCTLIILNFLVESMLQTRAGVLFYVFFLCFFLQYDFGKFDSLTSQDTSPT